MPSVALIANGAIHDSDTTAQLVKKHPFIVAVNGGLGHCSRMDVFPDLIIGDLDSVSQELLAKYPEVKRQKFLRDKDLTDLELAIKAVNQPDLERIVVFGGMGRRTDHSLSNLYLARKYPLKVFFENEREIVFSIKGHVDIACFQGQTVSLIPFGSPANGITTHGLKWEIQDATLDKNYMSISNVCLSSSFQVEIGEGDLICCLSK